MSDKNGTLSDANPEGTLLEGYRNHWDRFRIERSELLKAAEWVQKHKIECPGDLDIMLAANSASGIGTNVIVRCTKCNLACDVTDYGSW